MNKSSSYITVKPATSTASSPANLTFQGTVEIPVAQLRKVSIGKSGAKVRAFMAQLAQLSALIATLPNGQEKADAMGKKRDLVLHLGEETREYYQPRRLWGLKEDAFSQVGTSPFVQGEIGADGKTLTLGMYSAGDATTQLIVETGEGIYDILAGAGVPDRLASAKVNADGKSDLIKAPPADVLFEARSGASSSPKIFNGPRLSQAKRSNK